MTPALPRAHFVAGDVVHVFPVHACGALRAHTHQLDVSRVVTSPDGTTRLELDRPLALRHHRHPACAGLHTLVLTLDEHGQVLEARYQSDDGRQGASQATARFAVYLVKPAIRR